MLMRRRLLRTAAVGGVAYAAGHHMATKSAEQQQMDAQQNAQIADVCIASPIIFLGDFSTYEVLPLHSFSTSGKAPPGTTNAKNLGPPRQKPTHGAS